MTMTHPYDPPLPLALQQRVDEVQAENAQLQSALTGLGSEVAQVCAGPTLPMPVAPKALVQGGLRQGPPLAADPRHPHGRTVP